MSESHNTSIAEEIRNKWKDHSAELFSRDGKSIKPSHRYGGQNLVGNPLLVSTLNEIADSFVAASAEKAAGFDDEHAIIARAKRLHITYDQDDRMVIQIYRIQLKREKIDDELLHLEDQAIKRLLAPDSGLEQEFARRVGLGAEATDGQREITAKELLGSTIHILVDCCLAHLQGMERSGFIPNPQKSGLSR